MTEWFTDLLTYTIDHTPLLHRSQPIQIPRILCSGLWFFKLRLNGDWLDHICSATQNHSVIRNTPTHHWLWQLYAIQIYAIIISKRSRTSRCDLFPGGNSDSHAQYETQSPTVKCARTMTHNIMHQRAQNIQPRQQYYSNHVETHLCASMTKNQSRTLMRDFASQST